MTNITTLLPDVETLLALEPAELAPYVLEVARAQMQGSGVNEGNGILYGMFRGGPAAENNPNAYPANKQGEVGLAVTEAFSWLKANQLLVPAEGINGQNGWLRLGRRAQRMGAADFRHFVAASLFPKALLHQLIAEDVWARLIRGEYDLAVFTAFRAVEEQVRIAGGYAATDLGVALVRRAFDPNNGPLTKMADPFPEREALAHLFAGAIGSYKNPHSHRTVALEDAREAQEIVMLASHLLRIIDARRPG